jgi:hypothetical protein
MLSLAVFSNSQSSAGGVGCRVVMVMCASTPRFVLHVHAPLPGVACHNRALMQEPGVVVGSAV